MKVPMAVIVMGVSGSGKTEVGVRLARRLDTGFLEGDDFHPEANVQKMRGGHPLTDEDRHPWLTALNESLRDWADRGKSVVLACSALRGSYRTILGDGLDPESILWVYLKGEEKVIRERMERRRDHFFPPGLLDDQLRTLEEPEDALVVSIEQAPAEIVEQIVQWIEAGGVP